MVVGLLLTACNTNKNEQESAVASVDETAVVEAQAAPDPNDTLKPGIDYQVEIETSYGIMKVKLYDETPRHRDNFLKLAKEGFYDGLLFHRVIKEFMIQGGDPDSRGAAPQAVLGNGGPGYTIPAEFRNDLIHKKGALAAARTGDFINPKKESSGSQFYIVQGRTYSNEELIGISQGKRFSYTLDQLRVYRTIGGSPNLDRDYTVFGEVVYGLPVIDKIAVVETDNNDRPRVDIPMKIRVVEKREDNQ